MQDLKQELNNDQLWYKLYADDLVIVTPEKDIGIILEKLVNVSDRYNLRINRTKSGILL